MKFYIFRHAETYFSKFDIHYGESVESAEIIPEGIPVTERLAKYLAGEDIDAYYTSPFKRCTQTAEIIEKITKMKFIKDARIGEEMINYGKETFNGVIDRVKDFLDQIKTKKALAAGNRKTCCRARSQSFGINLQKIMVNCYKSSDY